MDEVKAVAQFALLFFGCWAILEILLSKKRKQMNERVSITSYDEGQLHSQRALQLLNEAMKTAQAEKPKSKS